MDIIAVMITYGGSNATICHGAGIRSRSLSDLVLELTFVNVLGELQTVSDPALLKSVGGCFGMLGNCSNSPSHCQKAINNIISLWLFQYFFIYLPI